MNVLKYNYWQKFLLFLIVGGCLIPALVQSQVAFRLNLTDPDQLDSFGYAICNDKGNTFCTYHRVPKYDSIFNYHSSVLYRISSDGDTNGLRINKQDTILYFNVAGFDPSGNIILGGNSYCIDSTGNRYGKFQYFLKVNEDLEILWEQMVQLESDSFITWGNEIAEIQDGRIISISSLQDVNTNELLMSAFILAANGDSIKYHVFDSDQYGLISSIVYDISMYTINLHMEQGPPSGGYSEIKRMVLDTNLEFVLIAPYPDDNYWGPFNTLQYKDNNLLSGGSYYDSSNEKDFISARIMDGSLNIENEVILCDGEKETYPAWDCPIDFSYNNRIFLSGMYDYQGFCPDAPNWIYLACLNDNLDLLYEEYWGGDAHYNIYSTVATPDGGVILSGFYYDYLSYSYQYDGFVIKFDSTFFVGIETLTNPGYSKSNFVVRGNRRAIYVDSDVNNAELNLFDLNGKCVVISPIISGRNDITTHLNTGIYIWKVAWGAESSTGKIHIY